MSHTTTNHAIVIEGPGSATVKTIPVPEPREDQVRVKVSAVGLNPTDWKHIDYLASPGSIVGCDYAGVVDAVGANLTRSFNVGDRIAGVVHGSNASNKTDGAFANFIVARTGAALHVPKSLSDTEAATLGVGVATVGQGLYQSLNLPLPKSSDKRTGTVLIYGGSTATGTLAIQYAKLSGWKVVATSSPHNFDLIKSLGADHVVDYSAKDAGKQIRDYTNDKLAHVFDCISTDDSIAIAVAALGSAGGKISTLLDVKLPASADATKITVQMTLAYTAMGQAFSKFGKDFPAIPQDYKFASDFFALSQTLLEEGKLKVHPVDARQGGLKGVLDGLDLLRKNKVSGKKLVYSV
ncbi:hypothetical protein HDU87_005779 [Geranomyces variabilis]|uniref:Enoyl reductase (ER) domain-containing protein n=1 Tax=Geranomyces variabilis TaxID=109894 RepID=A0AAD5TGY4_9FUNG|nr:hypothetical protein HDU87_005779 [Geranomyces variabilis]